MSPFRHIGAPEYDADEVFSVEITGAFHTRAVALVIHERKSASPMLGGTGEVKNIGDNLILRLGGVFLIFLLAPFKRVWIDVRRETPRIFNFHSVIIYGDIHLKVVKLPSPVGEGIEASLSQSV